ncbi:RGG repeats nuclear RNA binding protein B isoform X2 [Physcomitrium patens]|uniref:Hyaluronan/mRNA-binding protein domain-containing protein n=1 Tax=Physcomitrium patens TaxID=3218 RepID=A0A7I4BWS8_PHYPA|nr:RGG repeats nuclear RNA binding protein A-like isoform X2 [Physcomitrium patens]|eukprot:XP_024379973.1 RGG repeats nuclear RNA binding protein A-like isoform X2 [Physcomitrella patens]
MATRNFFDLLGDDENEDPSQVVVRVNPAAPVETTKPAAADKKKPVAAANLPTKPAPPSEAVRDGRRGQYNGARGGRDGGVRGGRGGGGYNGDRESGGPREGGGYRERGNYNNDRNVSKTGDADGFVGGRSSFDRPARTENGEGRPYENSRGGGRGRGRGGRGSGEGDDRRPRREFDRQSGNSRGENVEGTKEENKPVVEGEIKEKPEQESSVDVPVEEGTTVKNEEEEEDKEMTLEEYEKVMEEKRKTLEASKASERKVEVDKAFEKMQLVSNKKREEDIFIKLGQEKEKSKREAAEREEKSRKPVSINQFLKPAEGEKSYFPSNRGRGGRGGRDDRRESGGRGNRESTRSNFSAGRGGGGRGSAAGDASAPKIEDQAQFPTLGAK